MSRSNLGEYGDDSDGLKDLHHLLWCRRPWSHGYAQGLRNHRYMVIKIPCETLHRPLHRHIQCIPVPDGRLCHIAVDRLDEAMRRHDIDIQNDPPSVRLQFLIELLGDQAASTVKALKKEQRFFYAYEQQHAAMAPPQPALQLAPDLIILERNPVLALAAF